jgi:hypothetical protein
MIIPNFHFQSEEDDRFLDPLLDVVLDWRLTGDLRKAANDFKFSLVDDLQLDPYR